MSKVLSYIEENASLSPVFCWETQSVSLAKELLVAVFFLSWSLVIFLLFFKKEGPL